MNIKKHISNFMGRLVRSLTYLTLTLAVACTIMAFTARVYMQGERYVVSNARTTWNRVIGDLAQAHGYAMHVKLDPITREGVILREAKINRVPVSLVRAVIKAESNNKPQAVSSAGARGLMQVMPSWLSYCSLQDASELFDEEENIKCGTRILALALESQKGNVLMALKEYNAGVKRIDKTQENRNYPQKVLAKLE